jgi:hypothetical protein
MKKWMQLLSELELLPKFFGADWSTLWLQPVGGTITLVPEVTSSAYWNIINNPTYKSMAEYILRGERATWHRISRIQNHYSLEKAVKHSLRNLLKQKQNQMREFRIQPTIPRIGYPQLTFEEEKDKFPEFECKESVPCGIPLEDIEVDTPIATQTVGRPAKHNLPKPTSPRESNSTVNEQPTSLRRQSLSAITSTLVNLARASSSVLSPKPSEDDNEAWNQFSNSDGLHSRSPSPVDIPPVVFDENGKAFLTDEDYDDEEEPECPSFTEDDSNSG